MVWSWLRCEAMLATMLGFVGRAVASAAACIGCFRSSDSPYRILPAPDGEVIENHNAVSDLSVPNDEFQRDDEERWNLLFDGFDVGELEDEAKFLKTCGTIPETPVEIRKALSAENVEAKSYGFNPAPTEKLNLEIEGDKCSRGTDSSVGTPNPNSRMIEGSHSRKDSESSENGMTPTDTKEKRTLCSEVSSVSPRALHTSPQCRQKTVRFDFEPESSSFSSECPSSDSSIKRSYRSGSTAHKSVCPTPLKLNDEMQTPGTTFTGYLRNATDGKTARMIRSQYVYTVPNPVEYPNHLKELNREIYGLASLQELDVNGYETLASTPGAGKAVKDIKSNEPALADQEDGYLEHFDSDSKENVYGWKTPRYRPMLGDETSHVSPQCWGENGIPNSTTKYKEDQKVHWHETPFEKRLEKALSARTFVLQERRA